MYVLNLYIITSLSTEYVNVEVDISETGGQGAAPLTVELSLIHIYYEKAQNLYQEQLANNVNDVEMDRLKELYDQAVANGWIQ